jgi:hypothetical protein
MRLRRPTLGEVGGFLTVTWLAYQLVHAIWPTGPDLVAFEQTSDLGLPPSHLRFLQDMDTFRREDVQAMVAVAEAAKEQNKETYGRGGLLDSLKEFCATTQILGPLQNSITMVKVVNNGSKPARNVNLFFPEAGWVEIRSEGSSPRAEETNGRVELFSLEAGGQCVVRFWPKASPMFKEIRLVSDEGPAPVRPMTVSTEEFRWIVGFGFRELGLWVFVVAILLLMSVKIYTQKFLAKQAKGEPVD